MHSHRYPQGDSSAPSRIFGREWILFFGCTVLSILQSHSQPLTTSARSAGLSDATVALPEYSADFINPASFSSTRNWRVSFFASRAYNLPDLRFGAAQMTFPAASTTLAVRMQAFGRDIYHEFFGRAGISRPFYIGTSRPIFLGLSGAVRRVVIREYGYGMAVGWKAGALFELWPNLYWGFTYQQAIQSSDALPFPSETAAGFAFRPLEGNWLMASIRKEVFFPAVLSMGIESRLGKRMDVRCGFSTSPVRFALGSAVRAGPIAIDMAAERHELLGWTPGVSIDWALAQPGN